MLDIVALFLVLVVCPLIVFFGLGAISLFAYSRWTRRGVDYKNLFRALWPALMVSIGFPIVVSLTVGIVLGPLIGYGFVVVLLVLTTAVTFGSYVYFAVKGITGFKPK